MGMDIKYSLVVWDSNTLFASSVIPGTKMTFFTFSHTWCVEGKHDWLMLVFNENLCMNLSWGFYREASAMDTIFHFNGRIAQLVQNITKKIVLDDQEIE